MDIDVRLVTEPEHDAWLKTAERTFGFPYAEDDRLAMERSVIEFDRSFGAFDGDTMVGTTGSYAFTMTVPGGADLPTAGVSMVTVTPSHRRRGILTAMLRSQLDDVAARGEPLAGLFASEASIYDRFGFGPAIYASTFAVDTRTAAFREPLGDHGTFDVLYRDEARDVVAGVYERYRPTRSGSIGRSPAWWAVMLGAIEDWRGGGPTTVVVHRPPSGEPDGYALYRYHPNIEGGLQVGSVAVHDIVGLDADVEAALWRFVLDLDLSIQVVAAQRPADDPVRWRLAEPRVLTTVDHVDQLWLRLVDVGDALAQRRYASDDELTVEVTDPFLPANEGCYVIGGSGAGRRTDGEPDLTVPVSSLAATYLGGVSFTTLAAARQVIEHRPSALRRADALFVTAHQPRCTTKF